MTDDATHQDADGNPTYPGHRESRLSHDRGADAWYQQAKRGTEQWVELFEAHNRGDDLGPIFERHVSEASDAIEAALRSVPAPTEPEHEPWCYRRHTGDCVDGPSPESVVPAPTLPALDVRLRRMVDPLTAARNNARVLDEQMQGDPRVIGELRASLAELNRMLEALRDAV